MSEPHKKHRHDVGSPDHAARSTEPITSGIQFVLALSIFGTLALLIWLAALATQTP